MACTYTFKGTVYSEAEFNQFLSDNPNLKEQYLGGTLPIEITNVEEERLVQTKQLAQFKSEVKSGVPELFESNPELANSVYEALEFKKEINSRLTISQEGSDGFGYVLGLFDNKSERIGKIVYRNKTYLKDKGFPNVNELHLGFEENYQGKGYFQDALVELLNYDDSPIFISNGRVINDNVFKAINKLDISKLNINKIEDGYIITLNNEITPQQKQQAQQLYSQYLNTVFPDSQVKDIVYHGTDNINFQKFYDNLRSGIHFGTITQAQGRRKASDFEFKNNAKFIPSILNIKSPLRTKDYDWEKAGIAFEMWQPGDDLSDVDFTEYLISSGTIKEEDIQNAEGDFDLLNKKGYDGVIYKNEGAGETTGEDSYAVAKENQIHILGSKQDIEGFNNFIQANPNIQEASFYSLNTSEEKTTVIKAHKFIQEKLADYANRVKAFPKDETIKTVVDKLLGTQINLDLAVLDLQAIVKALETDYDYSSTILHGADGNGGIIARLKRYRNMDMNELVHNEDKRIEFTDTMRNINTFLRGYSRIEKISSEDVTAGWNPIVEQINDVVTWHQELLKDINNARSMYSDLITDFFMVRNNEISTNPNIKEGIMDIFTATDDESTKQLWLDAMADTHNAFIATTIKNYVRQMGVAQDEILVEQQNLRMALKAAFGLSDLNDIGKITKEQFSKYLEKDSAGRFTGRLVQQYLVEQYFADLNAFTKQITSLPQHRYSQELSNWYKQNTVSLYTEEELNDIVANKKATLSVREFEKWYKDNFIIDPATRERIPKVNGSLARPADKYLNKDFESISQDAFYKYMTETLAKLIDGYDRYNIVANGYIPAKKATDGKFSIVEYYNKHKAKKPSEFLGEGNEVIRILTLDMVQKLDQQPVFNLGKPYPHESYESYTMRVLMEAENLGFGKFDTLDELKEENARRREENQIRHGKAIDTNLYNVMNSFISKAITYKYKKQIEDEVTLALYQTDQLKFVKRKQNGDRFVNNVTNRLFNRGNLEAEMLIPNSNLQRHFTGWLEAIFYDNFDIDQGHFTAIGKLLLKYVSAKNMWLNASSAINNVAYGNLMIKIERAAAYFVTGDDLHRAEKDYWSNVVNMLADFRNDTSSNLITAMLKRFDIVENQIDRDIETKIVWKHLVSTDAFYFMQEMGEHWMQNKMLLAMMHSHRLIDGKAVSLQDYIDANRKQVLDDILSPNEKMRLNEYIERRKEKEQYIEGKHNYIEDFLMKYIAPEKLKLYNDAKKKQKEELTEEFKQYTEIFDLFELKDGVAVVKKTTEGDVSTPAITAEELAEFTQRVRKVNQSMHGIYNKNDASMIQRGALGKLAMQFRKWVIPGINRRFGSRFFKSYWSESRKSWDKGYYQSINQFLATPFRKDSTLTVENTEEAGKAISNIFGDMYKFVTNLKIYYNALDDFEQAQVRRALTEMGYLLITLALGMLSTMLIGGDDKKKKLPLIADLWFYQLDRMSSELGFYTPFGLINEGQKIMRAPAAATTAIQDVLNLLGQSFMFMYSPDTRYYKGGIYNKELKLGVATGKMIPIYNQWMKMKRVDKFNQYYNLYFF